MSEHMPSLFEATKRAAGKSVYPGYPDKRLVISDTSTIENMTLPDGEWSTNIPVFPSLEIQKRLQEEGYALDNFGRPLHPWLAEMLTDPEVGVVTGLGKYWNWGPNHAADPIVMNTDEIPQVLLIQRGDTYIWALPGGFVDSGETGRVTAQRELFEETNVMITGEPIEIYNDVVADTRTTAHAWAETTAVLWRVHGTPVAKAKDDAIDAKWFPINELPQDLHGSHSILIEQAVYRLDEVEPTHALSIPAAGESYRTASGGHMTYHRFIVKTTDGDVFIKSHDKHAFTDPIREAHSKQYLHKEKRMYDHIYSHGFTSIPLTVDIYDDHNLVMEGFAQEEGWHWRAPKEQIDRYIDEVMTSLSDLQAIPLPDDFHDTILPTHETQIGEGWRSIDEIAVGNIQARLREWQPKLRSDFQHAAENLSRDLPALAEKFLGITGPETFYFAHHDLRQANLAWHPNLGTKIVDWSWAGKGRKNSDATTLLIDLHKSGHDIQKHMGCFNTDHALTLIGFWLAHSLWPTRTDDTSVRFHQIASAVSAYDLLMKYRQRGINPVPA
jgi:ADP-ribose pyrophosphatase YjhB (NUDIX family)